MAVAMRVEKFSLFFPPTLFSRKRGETEYAIGAIPAGGYVKITGMNPDEELPDEVRDRAYHAQPVWKRIAVILAGPAVNLLLALLLLFVFWVSIGQPRESTTRIEAVDKRSPAQRCFLIWGVYFSGPPCTPSTESTRSPGRRTAAAGEPLSIAPTRSVTVAA